MLEEMDVLRRELAGESEGTLSIAEILTPMVVRALAVVVVSATLGLIAYARVRRPLALDSDEAQEKTPLSAHSLGLVVGAAKAGRAWRARTPGVVDPRCGSVAFLQRFGSDLRSNLHFHVLAPDGVFLESGTEPLLHEVGAPTARTKDTRDTALGACRAPQSARR